MRVGLTYKRAEGRHIQGRGRHIQGKREAYTGYERLSGTSLGSQDRYMRLSGASLGSQDR